MATSTLSALSRREGPSTIDTVQALLTTNFRAIKSCLPKHLTPERMCRIAVESLQRNPTVLSCTPESLFKCVVEASSLGLEIDSRGLAYVVPYGNKNQGGRKNATLIIGYKGLMDLAYRSGRVANIYAEIVCENDEFEYELGLEPRLAHIPALEGRGRMIAVYAVARMKDADPVFVVLGRQDVEKVRKSSMTRDSGPWVQWTEEMWKKTAIRRLCKYLPLSPEIAKAIAIDEASDAGVQLADCVIDIPEPPAIEQAETEPDNDELDAPEPDRPEKAPVTIPGLIED